MPPRHSEPPDLAIMLGAPEGGPEPGGEKLSPEEIHLRKRHEAMNCIKAVKEGDGDAFLRCFEELHALDHESWEEEGGEEESEEPEEDEEPDGMEGKGL